MRGTDPETVSPKLKLAESRFLLLPLPELGSHGMMGRRTRKSQCPIKSRPMSTSPCEIWLPSSASHHALCLGWDISMSTCKNRTSSEIGGLSGAIDMWIPCISPRETCGARTNSREPRIGNDLKSSVARNLMVGMEKSEPLPFRSTATITIKFSMRLEQSHRDSHQSFRESYQ
jgi:hypothetical protein